MEKIYLKTTFFIILLFCLNTSVFASTIDDLKSVEYTDAYKKYLSLSDEERNQYTIIPSPYEVPSSSVGNTNPIKQMAKVGASFESKFSLKDSGWLPNLKVRNQNPTTLCWAFSSLSSLETNLSLQNKSIYYDFSESHMDYSTVRNFLNNKKNPYGISRTPGSTATWYTPIAYLTNGQGAIDESDMPFDNYKNSEASHTQIDISNIQNKTVKSEVYDITLYPSNMSKDEAIAEIKKNIKLHGSVAAQVYGAQLFSDYYNNSTGAIYRGDDARNHAVSIIGWDDTYPISNFNTAHRPSSPGAWIVRNSWGETIISNGQNIAIGDNGFMYISYEDGNIYRSMIDVSKATAEKSYDNIYQYDEQGCVESQSKLGNANTIYLGNYYQKKSSENEFLTHVGIFAPETYTCKVYVNPNSRSMAKSDLQQVTLKEGDGQSETFEAGYHTLEFEEPIKLTSSEFSVVIQIIGTNSGGVNFALEANYGDNAQAGSIHEDYTDITISDSKCFVCAAEDFENNSWIDLTKLHENRSDLLNSDSTIKAFTTNEVIDTSLNRIEVTSAPYKTNYVEGENFDVSGMAVTAYFNDDTYRILDLSEYELSNATNLKLNQTSVTITFEGKSTVQAILVTAKVTPTVSPSITPTPTPTVTPTVSPSITPSPSPTVIPTVTPSPTPTVAPTATPTVTPVPSEPQPQNSSFNSVNALVSSLSKDTIVITLNNFNQNNNNEKLDYYYYLSNSKNENTAVMSFIKINNERISGNSLQFEINRNDIQHFAELESADKVYLFVKEVASIGSNQSIQVSNSIELSIPSSTKIEELNEDSRGGASINDDTVAKDPIPQTGASPAIIIAIITSALVVLILSVRYVFLKNK